MAVTCQNWVNYGQLFKDKREVIFNILTKHLHTVKAFSHLCIMTNSFLRANWIKKCLK